MPLLCSQSRSLTSSTFSSSMLGAQQARPRCLPRCSGRASRATSTTSPGPYASASTQGITSPCRGCTCTRSATVAWWTTCSARAGRLGVAPCRPRTRPSRWWWKSWHGRTAPGLSRPRRFRRRLLRRAPRSAAAWVDRRGIALALGIARRSIIAALTTRTLAWAPARRWVAATSPRAALAPAKQAAPRPAIAARTSRAPVPHSSRRRRRRRRRRQRCGAGGPRGVEHLEEEDLPVDEPHRGLRGRVRASPVLDLEVPRHLVDELQAAAHPPLPGPRTRPCRGRCRGAGSVGSPKRQHRRLQRPEGRGAQSREGATLSGPKLREEPEMRLGDVHIGLVVGLGGARGAGGRRRAHGDGIMLMQIRCVIRRPLASPSA
mmetsp:Transcript_164383/g.527172  ORF Transcript_164383/g.527172 Transcript_164383/m.527172 type:complete len:375 (+) Transcript_164383:612-1736(+)